MLHQVDPVRPKPVQLANHLAELASDQGLSASTLRTRRTAINTTLRQLGYPPLVEESIITGVIKGVALRAAKARRTVPHWDIFLVLAFLRENQFEPLLQASLTNLTHKTFFLLALASSRRISEVHSLSGLDRDIAFEANGDLTLRFLPEFLAKNQTAGVESPIIRIPSLEKVLSGDDPDRMNCPVRALKAYRERTAKFRAPGARRLFISCNPGHGKDILKSTLARWVGTLIRSAYQWASKIRSHNDNLSLTSAHAHEIRAWSSSLGAAHGLSMRKLLDAAYWQSQDVFIKHYLRDHARLKGDGSWGVGSLVAAQSVLCP
jgi:hypothetical protein